MELKFTESSSWFRSVNNAEKSGSVKGSDKITRSRCKGEAKSHVAFSYAIKVLGFDKVVLCCEKSEAHYVTCFTFYKCPPLPLKRSTSSFCKNYSGSAFKKNHNKRHTKPQRRLCRYLMKREVRAI